MDNKKKILIALVVVLLVAVVALLVMQNRNQTAKNKQPIDTASSTVPLEVKKLPPPGIQRIKDDSQYPAGLKQLAINFAERYGSHSFDDQSGNLSDLQGQMTSKMQKTAKDFISSYYASSSHAGFEGYSTRALSTRIASISAERAVILVSTQQEKTAADGNFELSYPKIQLDFVKSGSSWLVDDAQWQ